MSVQTMGIATTPLAAHAMLIDKSLATVPTFLQHAGLMATTIPASLLMAWIGRRGGFTVGALTGIGAGIISFLAILWQNFALLCIGGFLQGAAASFAWYFRFAAADASQPAFKPKAISLVMAGGVLAAFMGPMTAKWAVDWLEPLTFAGCYVMMAIFSAAVLLVVQAVRIPGLTAAEKSEGGRPMREIIRQPAYVVALISSMFGYGVMTLVMSATPLAMLACGFKFGDSATVITAHVVAMFLPSFFTGHLITRFGVLPIMIAGALISTGCGVVNLLGVDYWNFFLANILVGLGWNFMYVGGSTLLTTTYRPGRARQGAGEPRLHGLCDDGDGRRSVGLPAGQRRLDADQHDRHPLDGRRHDRRVLARQPSPPPPCDRTGGIVRRSRPSGNDQQGATA